MGGKECDRALTGVVQIQQFQKRFKKIPKILELDHLTVTGDVYFGRNVTLRGTVISASSSFPPFLG